MIPSDASDRSCLIVGAGPAGIAPLVAAAHAGKLHEMLAAGVTIVERSGHVGAGSIGSYAISSDSAAEAFLDAVMRTTEPRLAALRSHPVVVAIQERVGSSVPLELAADYLQLVGETLCELVDASPKGAVLKNHTALSTRSSGGGAWITRVRCNRTGREQEIKTTSVVMAAGAHQPLSRLHTEKIAGETLLPRYAGKVMQSGEVLSQGGLAAARERLRGRSGPRVVVVGGSTSAAAVARLLLDEINFGPAGVTLMHRQKLRIFYHSAEEALRDGYTDFGPQDICKLSGRVYRLAGFRLESRELMMRALGVGGRPGEPRLRLHALPEHGPLETRRLLDEADLIVAALGYRPRGLAVLDEDFCPVPLHGAGDAMQALVNDDCEVMAEDSSPIPGLYAVGLAAGFVPHGALGGEESFQGQANSLWLWQHDVGERIVDAVGRNHAESVQRRCGGFKGKKRAISSVPMSRPNPPRLSEHAAALQGIEDSRFFSNFGPTVQRFERALRDEMFRTGACLTVSNATLGLMLAIRQGLMKRPAVGRGFALMPSFTFAATAHAAVWNGLTPLFCDIDAETWLPSAEAEEALLRQYGDEIAVILPCATFGNNLDMARYDRLHAAYGVEVVVDAAASLGSLDGRGRSFGDGCRWPVVFSLHATKPFAAGEGGVIYCDDVARLEQLRAMSGFGFEQPRVATLPGLNAKMSEVTALSAYLRLEGYEAVVKHREGLGAMYAARLPGWQMQKKVGRRQCHTYQSILLPEDLAGARGSLVATLRERGIGAGTYFSPHLAEQPYFVDTGVAGPLDVTYEISSRILTLPMYDEMVEDEVAYVASNLLDVAMMKRNEAETAAGALDQEALAT